MINKKVSPKGKKVRVTFELPGEVASERVSVVGDFNDWNPAEGEMTFVKTRNVWKKEVSLDAGQTYQFRYFIDGEKWANDDEADGAVPNEYFSQNSVLSL
ncbi:isoamylase early set domain-containing protein [Rhodocaloribacter litoris]|uniref:isoamylase early set domain-containing protein n=1 Tax=Rhodocaloribacter litoris TaxID=2558931 RepID=UPI00141DB0EE|nr:isoamylase early set domain-containing protein [Rhodocaloribacter litoris]QXD16351.1 isoamylase early set domain-containing protein [Rhodocaloribacter litoris]